MCAMTFNRACHLTMVAAVLWFFVRPALADGPPMDGPHTVDPVCVHYTCAATCTGARDLSACYDRCQRQMQAPTCDPCCEPAPVKPVPPGRPEPTP